MAKCTDCAHNNVHPNVCYSCIGGRHFWPKKMTNADRIRAMTDEELAEWLENIDTAYEPETVVSQRGWLDWLRMEAPNG